MADYSTQVINQKTMATTPPPTANQQFLSNLTGGTSPSMPTFNSNIGDTGLLKNPYQLGTPQTVSPNTQALETLRNNATSTGPSPWAQAAMSKQASEQAMAKNDAQKASSSARATGMSSLAMSGGLSGAARERLTNSANNTLMSQRQTVNRQGITDRANIDLNDQQQKQATLMALPGMENANAQIQFQNLANQTDASKYNIGNALSEINAGRTFDQNQFDELMKAWAANQTALGIANSGTGNTGGLLGGLGGVSGALNPIGNGVSSALGGGTLGQIGKWVANPVAAAGDTVKSWFGW